MITTNINGNTISQAFIDEIRSDSPNVIAKLLLNGTEIDCDIARITIQKGSCGSQNFALGDVVGTKLLATVKNLSDTLKGEVIECQIGAWTGVSYEYISVCKAKVSECKSTRYQTDITAYSSVVSDTTEKFDVTNLSSNPTISDIADEVETQINHTITFDPSIDTSKVVMQTLNGLNIYQVLQVIAICSGGYVCNSHDNEICVKQFGGTATIIVSSGAILTTSSGDHIIALGTNAQEELPVDTGMMVKLPEREEELYSITGIYCLVQEASVDNDGNDIPAIEYQSGTVNYAIESKYVTSDIFNANLKTIIGYGYYPANVNLTLGDPRLEGDDVLNVTDVDGTQYLVPCHIITHTYSGGISSVIKSAEASALENDVGTMPPITAQLSVMKQDTVKAQTTADEAQTIARNNAQYFWFLESDPNNTGVGTGAHITETPKEDFMDDPTNGGGNLLARSNGIAVRDGLTELATFDSEGHDVYKNGTGVAHFGTDIRLGTSATNFTLTADATTGNYYMVCKRANVVKGRLFVSGDCLGLETNGTGTFTQSGNIVLQSEIGSGNTRYGAVDIFSRKANGSEYGIRIAPTGLTASAVAKVLWSGASYMSEGQSVDLTEAVSEQLNGVVLVWSRYANSTAHNDSWSYDFIPKWHTIYHDGGGVYCSMPTGTKTNTVCNKYVYVYDMSVEGHADNTATGTGYANNARVLRAVLGV